MSVKGNQQKNTFLTAIGHILTESDVHVISGVTSAAHDPQHHTLSTTKE